ncbi:MAG: hypothetical protein WCQ95_12725 [Bacteroidota bacterium]
MEVYSPRNKSHDLFKLNQLKKDSEPKAKVVPTLATAIEAEVVYFRQGSGFVERESLLVRTRRVFYDKLRVFFESDEVV